MHTHAEKTQDNKINAVANNLPKQQIENEPVFEFHDHRSEAIAQRKIQTAINQSLPIRQYQVYQEMANYSPQVKQLKAYQAIADAFTSQTLQRKENKTGLPDELKSGIEHLSGYSLDDVKVHYNSQLPAQLQAHAYAQGTDIHVAPGQEKHLPHEAWHVVQQKQGRVSPTLQLKNNLNINDDDALEQEADLMGMKANGMVAQKASIQTKQPAIQSPVIQRMPGDYPILSAMNGVEVTIEYINHGEWITLKGPISRVLSTSIYIGAKRFVKSHVNDHDFRMVEPSSYKPMDHADSVREFTGAMDKHSEGWADFTVQKKIGIFKTLITDKFTAYGMPAPLITEMNLERRNGEFNSASWSFAISSESLNNATLADLSATVYHETRHAEQAFMIAQYLLKNDMPLPLHNQIPENVLEAAKKRKLSPQEEAKAKIYYDSIYGAGHKERNFVLTRLGIYTSAAVKQKTDLLSPAKSKMDTKYADATQYKTANIARVGESNWPDAKGAENKAAYIAAKNEFIKAKDEANEAQAKYKIAQEEYKNLPEEADAHAVGDQVRDLLTPAAAH